MEQSDMAAPLSAYADQMLSGLGPPELIRLMIGDEDRVPRNVIDECARRGEEMVRALQNATGAERFWQGDAALGEWWLRLHAVMILGLIASERAGLALVSFMRRMARARDDDLDDWLGGYWPALFRNKPETVVVPLRELAHDRSVEWSMRTEAVESVVALGERHGAEALEAALDWAVATAADPSEDSMLRQSLFDLLVDFPRERHRALLESFARQPEMEGTFAEEAVREAFSGVEDTPLWRDFADPWDFYAPEAIAGRQAEEDPAGEDVEAEEVELEDFFGDDEPPLPYVRPDPKIGRNDPCPCGSGKKYKRCCLAAQNALPDRVDPVWERLHRFNDQSPAKMLRFADELFGSAALAEAWDEFTLGKGVAFDPQSPHLQAFMPWFFYDWTPDESATRIRKGAPRGATVADAYLRFKGRHLDPLERRYLEACLAAPFSFHEVLECRPGQGFRLRDILTGEERDVSERSGSGGAQKGDIMFAKVVPIEHLALVDGYSPVVIGPGEKAPIIELRRALRAEGVRLAAESLRAHAPEIFKVYHALAGPLREFGTPELRNTDGDALSFHRLLYEIDSPQAAFDALKELALDAPEEELLSRSERDTSGALKKVEFGWLKRGNAQHKHWDNTVLGHISIDGSTLAVEVNSRRRADAFRALAEERLKGCARYRTATVEPAGAMLERARRDKDPEDESSRKLDELKARPEVQALVADQLQAHYAAWPDQRLPALGGRTPLEAVQDPDGREMVEALLLDIGRLLRAQLPGLEERIVGRVRERLGFA